MGKAVDDDETDDVDGKDDVDDEVDEVEMVAVGNVVDRTKTGIFSGKKCIKSQPLDDQDNFKK